jgi:hypothetical protein
MSIASLAEVVESSNASVNYQADVNEAYLSSKVSISAGPPTLSTHLLLFSPCLTNRAFRSGGQSVAFMLPAQSTWQCSGGMEEGGVR